MLVLLFSILKKAGNLAQVNGKTHRKMAEKRYFGFINAKTH